MTIKAKLIANGLVTALIMVLISMASYSSINFIQEKLSYLTDKSTPFQMRTVEFQRELERSASNLIKVNTARDLAEFKAFRAEAEESLRNIHITQGLLGKMDGSSSRLAVYEELDPVAAELFVATEARINSDVSAKKANTKISQQMKDSSARLKKLESHIRTLQITRSAAFTKALKNTEQFSAILRGLEELHSQINDLITASVAAHNTKDNFSFLVAKGKVRTLLGRIAKSKRGKDLKPLADDVDEFLQFQAAAISKKDEDSEKWAAAAFKELAENMNRLHLSLSLEIELATAHLEIENRRQGDIFNQSNSANSILLANSELVAAGLMATGEINRLFNLDSAVELDKLDSEIRQLFIRISAIEKTLETSLSSLNAEEELKIFRNAAGSLAAIRTELHSANGIIATLQKKLATTKQANNSTDKLHAIVAQQSAKANNRVSEARGEQKEAIAAVSKMTGQSLYQIGGIVSVAIAIGILFSFWIYRSVLLPLLVILDAVRRQQEQVKEKAILAEAVADGDLDREIFISKVIALDPTDIKNDEIGMVLNAVVGMSKAQVTLDKAFAKMTASLLKNRSEETRRDRLKSGLYELNKIIREELETAEMGDRALAFLADFLDAGVGILYLYNDEEKRLQALSTYAISRSKRLDEGFRLGEGLPGQAALERKKISLDSIPHGYLPISSALGEADPQHIAIMPIMHNDTLVGVLELGSFRRFSDDDFEFLNHSLEGVAVAFSVNRSRQRVYDLLEETQSQTEELRVQQEELQQSNEELAELVKHRQNVV